MAEKRLSNFQPTKCMLLEVYINQFSIESEPGQIIVAIVNESLGDRNGNNLHLHNFKICGAVHVRCQLHRQNKFDSFEKSAANLIFSHSFSVQSREVHDTTQNRKGIRGNKEHFILHRCSKRCYLHERFIAEANRLIFTNFNCVFAYFYRCLTLFSWRKYNFFFSLSSYLPPQSPQPPHDF